MKHAKKIRTRTYLIDRLSDERIQKMYALFERYYKDVNFDQFRADLAEKTHAFVFFDGKEIIGFSTIYRKKIPEVAPGTFLFSGDTVVHHQYWGSKFLQKAFFWYILESKVRSLFRPVYWMLISKSFKTYLMMRKNFSSAYPSPYREMPNQVREVRDRFYAWKFGSAYDPKTGLITFPKSLGSVKGAIACPNAQQLLDPEVQFFIQNNPNYSEGVEFACLTKIRAADFLGHIPKFFIKSLRRKPRPILPLGAEPATFSSSRQP